MRTTTVIPTSKSEQEINAIIEPFFASKGFKFKKFKGNMVKHSLSFYLLKAFLLR